MKLKKYIKKEKIRVGKAAKQLAISRQWLSLLINHDVPAGKDLAIRIAKWSNDEVSIFEAMQMNP